MKTMRDAFLNLLGVLVLIVIVILIVPNGIFPVATTGSEGGYPAPTTQTTPSQPMAYPGDWQGDTTVVEQPESTPLVHTPIPAVEGAFQASPTQLLTLQGNLNIKKMLDYHVSGDLLVVKAELGEGGTALLLIDLISGSVEKLLEVPNQPYAGFNELHASSQYVVWLDPAPGSNENLLQVLDVEQKEVFTLQSGRIQEIDLQDSMVVWNEAQSTDIFAYNLASEQLLEVVVDSRDARFPRVCSLEWIAFLHNFAEQERFVFSTSADLSIRHLVTGQEVLVGRVFNVSTIPGERITNFDCDNDRLAWVTSASLGNEPKSELHIYDFSSGENESIEAFQGDFEPYDNYVLLDRNIVISRVGYDLARQTPFTPIRDHVNFFGPLYLSNNKLVWVEDHENTAGAIYLVSISTGE